MILTSDYSVKFKNVGKYTSTPAYAFVLRCSLKYSGNLIFTVGDVRCLLYISGGTLAVVEICFHI
jgi:hypothetical protein